MTRPCLYQGRKRKPTMNPRAIFWLLAWHRWASQAVKCNRTISARKAAYHARTCYKQMVKEL